MLTPNFSIPQYPQLISQQSQQNEILQRAQYSQSPGASYPPSTSTLGINYHPAPTSKVTQTSPARTFSLQQNFHQSMDSETMTTQDQAFLSPTKTPANPSDISLKAMDTGEKNRKRTVGSPNTLPDNKKINSNPHIVQDKINRKIQSSLESQRQEEGSY